MRWSVGTWQGWPDAATEVNRTLDDDEMDDFQEATKGLLERFDFDAKEGCLQTG